LQHLQLTKVVRTSKNLVETDEIKTQAEAYVELYKKVRDGDLAQQTMLKNILTQFFKRKI
jgi:hypothetical protein